MIAQSPTDSRRRQRTTADLLAFAIAAAFTLGGCTPPEETPAELRNVVLITVDTTRADRMSLYGHETVTTPSLEALAAESTVFDLALAQAAVTPVSHASILTGLEPYHHGLRVLHGLVGNRLHDEAITLADTWRAAGGRSAAFVSAFPVTASFGLDQGFDHFDAEFQESDSQGVVDENGLVNVQMSQRRADDTTSAAIQWLSENAEDPRPLLLWIHYFDPHDLQVRPPDRILEKFRPESVDRADLLRAYYDAEIFFMDAQIGRLLDAVKARSLWDKTVVAVVGDHGEGLGDHDWWSHGVLYQEQIRVPMLIRTPEIPQGTRVSSLVRTIDLMPTLLELAGVQASHWPAMDGSSLLETMRSGENPEAQLAYADSVNILSYARTDDPERSDRKSDKLYSLTNGRYKLIYHQLAPENSEFYDLVADPEELENLAGDRPEAMRDLMRQLSGLEAFSDILPGMTESDAERIERLKSLGYVQ